MRHGEQSKGPAATVNGTPGSNRPWLPVAVLFVSLAITGLASWYAYTGSHRRDLSRFNNAVEAATATISERMNTYVDLLNSAAGLFAAHPETDVEAFHRYVARLEIARELPGIQGIGFSIHLPRTEAASLVERMRHEGVHDFRLWPEPERPQIDSIIYLEPRDRRNRAAVGYDMYSDPTRREAMARARDSGAPAMSGKVTLVQEIDPRKQAGFLVYVPVYEGGTVPSTIAERRRLLRGFVYSPFRADDLLSGIFANVQEPRVWFDIYDGSRKEAALLHRMPRDDVDPDYLPAFSRTTALHLGGRQWILHFDTRPEFDRASSRTEILFIPLGGIIFSLALFGVTRSQARARFEAESVAFSLAASEADLKEEKQTLEAVNRTGRMIAAELEVPGLVQHVTEAARELVGAPAAIFFLSHGDTLTAAASSSEGESGAALVSAFRDRDPYSEVFVLGEAIRVGDLQPESRAGTAARAYLAIPVLSRSRELLGVMVFIHTAGDAFTERDEQLMFALAAQTATAMDNARLFQEAGKERELAEEANRAKDEFLATLSHELRTPMTSILGWSSLLCDPALDEPTRKMAIDAIHQSSKVQSQLIDDLLDLSRIATGKLHIRPEVCDMRQVVQNGVAATRPDAEEKQIVLRFDAGDEPSAVWADPRRMQQVIWNLLTNAVKFTPPGGTIEVLVESRDETVAVTVKDSGEGIDPEFLPQVFGRFQQGDPSATRTHGGLGIGLSIVSHLVELHGGSVRAFSEGRGKGSSFTVRLPRIDPSEGEQLATEEKKGRRTRPSLAGVNILVVEDEPGVRQFVAAVLRQAGAVVSEAPSALMALNALRQNAVDVLVSDIAMPGMDGIELIRQIRELPEERLRALPAIALTAFARNEDKERIMAAGFDAYLRKPFEANVLIANVAQIASRPTASEPGSHGHAEASSNPTTDPRV